MKVSGNATVDYIITWQPNDNSGSDSVNNGNTQKNISGLNSNKNYAFQLQAKNNGGLGESSDEETFTTSKQIVLILF